VKQLKMKLNWGGEANSARIGNGNIYEEFMSASFGSKEGNFV